jgi:hypothetical protein
MMFRIASLFAGLVMLVALLQQPVDAIRLVQAFRDGTADQFKNRRIAGTGVNFHGHVSERTADGTTRTSLVITIGSAAAGPPPTLVKIIKTVDEFIAAERARTTMVVALSGSALPAPAGETPQTYEFSGIYDGQVRTIVRAGGPMSNAPDAGPCKGEGPQGSFEGTFYCAPLLVNATAAIKE